MKYYIYLFLLVFMVSCSNKSKSEDVIAKIPVSIKLDRFDKAFFETNPKNLAQLKAKYPAFFPKNTPDAVWIEKMQNPQWRELYAEVQKKHNNFIDKKEEIEELFQHIKYYFPDTKTPKIVTLIQEMDADYKVIYADSLVLISLEMYLGKNHKFYEFPQYQKNLFEPSQILPDIVNDFSLQKVKPPKDKDLLSLMIYSGKQMYLKDLLIPSYTDDDKIGYQPEETKYCIENEANMWRYFIEQNMLYNNSSDLIGKFIAPAPFSKFGLVSDNDTPGRIGVWFGWQIVKSYMENNDVTVAQLMVTDAKTLFEQSKYKPKK